MKHHCKYKSKGENIKFQYPKTPVTNQSPIPEYGSTFTSYLCDTEPNKYPAYCFLYTSVVSTTSIYTYP